MENQSKELKETQTHKLLLSFNSQVCPGQRWAINMEGIVMEIPEVVLAEICANPTHVMGWFNDKLRKAWKNIFPLTGRSAREGGLDLLDPAWTEARNPWWEFLTDTPLPKEECQLDWETLPQISPMPVLCEVNPMESLSERRMLEEQPISTFLMGNKHATKLIQVFHPTVVFSLHGLSQEMEMGVFQHNITMCPGEG